MGAPFTSPIANLPMQLESENWLIHLKKLQSLAFFSQPYHCVMKARKQLLQDAHRRKKPQKKTKNGPDAQRC